MEGGGVGKRPQFFEQIDVVQRPIIVAPQEYYRLVRCESTISPKVSGLEGFAGQTGKLRVWISPLGAW